MTAELPWDECRRLEIRDLRLVAAVAHTGTLTGAADRLHLTQSALSHQLRALEKRLEVPIFLRSHQRMQLTDAGNRLLPVAQEILHQLASAERELAGLARQRATTLRISTACYTTYNWLPAVLRSFRQTSPGAQVRIAPEHTRKPLEAVRRDLLELAILTAPVDEPGVETLPIFEDEMVILTSPNHPLTRSPFIETSALSETTILTYSAEPQESLLIGGILQPAGVVPRHVHAVPLTEAIIELVKAEAGVACLARWAVAPHLETGEIVARPLGPKGFHRTWLAAFRQRTPARPLIEAFTQHIAQHMKAQTRDARQL